MVGSGKLTDEPAVEDTPRWKRAAVFSAEPEAELARQQLVAEGIPVVVLSDRTGIFGPGFAGRSHIGLTVLVPAERLDEAREMIEDLIEAFGGTVPE